MNMDLKESFATIVASRVTNGIVVQDGAITVLVDQHRGAETCKTFKGSRSLVSRMDSSSHMSLAFRTLHRVNVRVNNNRNNGNLELRVLRCPQDYDEYIMRSSRRY